MLRKVFSNMSEMFSNFIDFCFEEEMVIIEVKANEQRRIEPTRYNAND